MIKPKVEGSKMDVEKTAESLVRRFSSSNKNPIFDVQSRKMPQPLGNHSMLTVLLPWNYNGRTQQVVISYSIARTGIVASISITNEEESFEVYAGCSEHKAYTDTIQWLWRHFGAEKIYLNR